MSGKTSGPFHFRRNFTIVRELPGCAIDDPVRKRLFGIWLRRRQLFKTKRDFFKAFLHAIPVAGGARVIAGLPIPGP